MADSKKLNLYLFLWTLIAGLVWWVVGEILFSFTKGGGDNFFRNPILNGLYFACLTILTIGACLFSEKVFCHSIVNERFFKMVVLGPSLLPILLISFVLMLFVSSILEFIYEIEPSPPKQKKIIEKSKQPKQKKIEDSGYDDYYFLLDNSVSLKGTDPYNERIKALEWIIDNLSDKRRIALVSFSDIVRIEMPLQFATNDVKTDFKKIINDISSSLGGSTNLGGGLKKIVSILLKDVSRSAAVILFSDGEDNHNEISYEESHFIKTMAPLFSDNIPIHTIFLSFNNNKYDDESVRNISKYTGGNFYIVDDSFYLKSNFAEAMKAPEITQALDPSQAGAISFNKQSKNEIEPLRDLTTKRFFKRQFSTLYILMHIFFITIIGGLMGFLLYVVFSHKRIFKPLLIGGVISGLLSGLVLEFGLQADFSEPFMRFLACVILSTVLWFIYLYDWNKAERYFKRGLIYKPYFNADNTVYGNPAFKNEKIDQHNSNVTYKNEIIHYPASDSGKKNNEESDK